MKKSLVILGFLIVAKSFSQKKDTIIEINPFGINKYPKKELLKYGNTLKFKINNVNTLKLSGAVKGEGKNIAFEIPKYFLVDNDKVDAIINNISSDTLVYDFLSDLNKLKQTKKNKKDEEEIIKNLKEKIEALGKKLASKTEFEENYNTFLDKLSKINSFLTLENKLNGLVKDSIFIKNIDYVHKTSEEYYEFTYEDTENPYKEIDDSFTELLESYKNMEFNYDAINESLEKNEELLEGEIKSKDGKTSLKIEKSLLNISRKKFFEKEINYAKKIYDSVSNQKNMKELKEIAHKGVNFYHKLQNEDFIVYSDSYQLEKDVEKLTPELKDTKGKVVYTFNPISVRVRKKLKVNFSSGYLLSFIGDENYSYLKDSTGVVGVYKSNRNRISHSLGGLVHFYSSSSNGFNIAGSTGISVNDEGNVGFYGGGSLMFLEENRLIFTLGLSYTKVNVLNKSNLNSDLEFTSNDIEIKYDNIYKPAFFVGITYNLSK